MNAKKNKIERKKYVIVICTGNKYNMIRIFNDLNNSVILFEHKHTRGDIYFIRIRRCSKP